MARQGRGALMVFACLVLVCLAQIVWWIYFLIRESRHLESARTEAAESQAAYAAVCLARDLGARPALADAQHYVAQHFPDLTLAPDGAVLVAPEFRSRLSQELRHRTTMFVSEGAFFMALTLGGVFLIYRALRHEMELKRQQRDFVASASHELKTPIAALRLALQTVARPELPPDKAARFLGHMEKDLERLEALVHMILQAGQIESGRLSLHAEELELAAFVNEHAQRMADLLRDRRCHLTVEAAAGLWVRADRQALHSILTNLVDNAAKYAQDGRAGEVSVRVRGNGGTALIEVRDNGIGIERRELERVFDRFYRGVDDAVRSRPGTGLGLYVVRRLVEEQGGRIEALSAGRGQGATFRIAFPMLAGKVA